MAIAEDRSTSEDEIGRETEEMRISYRFHSRIRQTRSRESMISERYRPAFSRVWILSGVLEAFYCVKHYKSITGGEENRRKMFHFPVAPAVGMTGDLMQFYT